MRGKVRTNPGLARRRQDDSAELRFEHGRKLRFLWLFSFVEFSSCVCDFRRNCALSAYVKVLAQPRLFT